MAGAAGRDAPERLDVDVQQLARVAALGAVGGSSRLSLPNPTRASTAETVEAAIARHHAISAPVIRSRRSSTITSTSSCGVRCGSDRGADDRSSRPELALSPVPGKPLRAGPLAHAGGLGRRPERPTPLEHPHHHRQTPLRTERRVSVNLHPVPSLGELSWLEHHSASKEARMNNVVRNYI
jgi:hypothetical protein